MNNKVKHIDTWPITISGFYLNSVEDNLQNILNYIKNDKNINAGDIGSLSENQNLFQKSLFEDVKKECLQCVKKYSKHLNHAVQDIKIVSSWSNTLRKNEYIPPHSHPNSYISGVIHLTEGSDLLFNRPDSGGLFNISFEYDIHEDMTLAINASPAQLVLFPSNLVHMVNFHQGEQTRYSIAFNTLPMKYGMLTKYVNCNNP